MKPCILCLTATIALAPAIASAQSSTSSTPGPTSPDPASSAAAQPSAAQPAVTATPPAGAAPADGAAAPAEAAPPADAGADPNKTKLYLGARFRDFIVPGFMFGMFADGGPGIVNVFSGGPELTVQMGALETIVSVTVPYADFSMNEFVFKSKDDPDQAYEIVSSSLKLITASVDLLGRIKVDKKGTVAILIGGGVGISGVLGDIRRGQAYPNDPEAIDPDDRAKWNKCRRPGDGTSTPDGVAYCGEDNDHYPDANGEDWTEESWTDGGSKPVVFPYVALPHIAVEFVPIEQLLLRLDTGFSITGFFFGIGAGGKLPI
ncbi:MAG: hypothetical protein IPG04_30355 [Polyangiaceae bacterium]|nr:hypothetical protein [Polyangiaceae bacterium]